ncbi:DUF177 domain-containing protein [Sphingomonas sp. LB-2]|uniref:YceD family protein n=1 Tax=Sphingomonas caeni TaxID=2984949 RepID=UPI0022328B18|nr:DUF177 domain-containing protein [Sphingomonas caeni]MCW3846541.1 DUF177 domain-containing protein [Sphingomonas caeni]
MTPEFSRPHPLDRIGAGEVSVSVAADEGERARLARRFGLIAIDALSADYRLRREGEAVHAGGHLSARVTQACVATGDPVPASVEEDFDLRFLPESAAGDEVEIDSEELDTVFYTGGAIDLGEAAAETLALALDPFPRSPEAAAVLRAAGVIGEDEVVRSSPFAALKDKFPK